MADRAFTAVDNLLFDALLAAPLHHRTKTVCFAIVRLTLGFGRAPMRAFSLELLAKLAAVESRALRKVLVELQDLGVVVRRDGGQGRRAAWGLTDPSTWKVPLGDVTPGRGDQGSFELGEGRHDQGTPGRGDPGSQLEPLVATTRGPLVVATLPRKESSERKKDIQSVGAAAAAAVCEVASLADEDLIAAAAPAFAAYGKQLEDGKRWGAARRSKLRERAAELARSGLAREDVLAAIVAAVHGFLWLHRDARRSEFDPWRLFTPDTVYGGGFDRYVESYAEATRAGKSAPFTTRHAKPVSPNARDRPPAATAPAERAPTALERAQIAALTALRHRLRRFPEPEEIEAEHARVAAEWEAKSCVA